MSGTFDKLFAKGKAKVKELTDNKPAQSQGYAGHAYPAPNQQQYGGAPPTQYQQQYPPHNCPSQQQQQWGLPSQQPQPQQQPQWAPPIPSASKPGAHQHPQSPGPPPIPQNRPHSAQPPPPQSVPSPQQQHSGVYWKPSFDHATPVAHNFRHEKGDHGWGNNERQMYTDNPANSFHHDNRLVVRGLVHGNSYTSARLTSHQTLSRPRGHLTATILAPVAPGAWPAYWMLPADPFTWPTDGEVDIFESWNGDCMNRSCLHWGHFNGPDHDKHRVIETHLPSMAHQPHTFGFAWQEEAGVPDWRGRMIWYIDGRPVMRGTIPAGTRRMEDYRILLNIAMGGNVCQGKLPADGYYDMVVSDMMMCESPPCGWGDGFEKDWSAAKEGKTM